jgi:thiol:disulfide interchange protein DsbD
MKINAKRNLSAGFAYLAVVLAMGAALQAAQAQSMPKPASVVTPQTFVSLDRVPRGQSFEAAVVVAIQQGFHMNSNKPSEDYLIPTTITANPPDGIRVVDTIYPLGEMKKFSFSPDKPLNVYSGSVTLRIKLAAEGKAALGPTTIPVTLRYQACNDTACLPPVKVPVIVNFEVFAAGTAAHRVHPEVFSAMAK